MNYFIYKHTNKENGKCYIGQTKNIKWRWYPNNYKTCSKFYRAILKYGWNNFTHEVIKICDETNVDYWESYYIKEYDSVTNGYNLDSGGCKNKVQSVETRQKKSNFMKGRQHTLGHPPWNKGLKMSEEYRLKLSIAHKGKTHASPSEETRRKISQAQVGKKISEETRKKLVLSHLGKPNKNKGKKLSKEWIEHMSIAHKGKTGWNKGKHLSEETKQKIRIAKLGCKPANTKKVINLDTKETFDSLVDACRKYNIAIQNLSKVVNGQRKNAGGYRWAFSNHT